VMSVAPTASITAGKSDRLPVISATISVAISRSCPRRRRSRRSSDDDVGRRTPSLQHQQGRRIGKQPPHPGRPQPDRGPSPSPNADSSLDPHALPDVPRNCPQMTHLGHYGHHRDRSVGP
jgi:hypothetical protein